MAAGVAEAAMMEALGQARPGDSVSDIMSAFRIELAERGADLEHLAVAPLGAGFAFHSHHVLHSDEALLVDFGCRSASFGVEQTFVVDSGGARLLTTQQRGEPVALTV